MKVFVASEVPKQGQVLLLCDTVVCKDGKNSAACARSLMTCLARPVMTKEGVQFHGNLFTLITIVS